MMYHWFESNAVIQHNLSVSVQYSDSVVWWHYEWFHWWFSVEIQRKIQNKIPLIDLYRKFQKEWLHTTGNIAVNSDTAMRMRSAPGTNTSFEVISCITDHSSWMRRVTTSVRCFTSSECGSVLPLVDDVDGVSVCCAGFPSFIWYILFALRLSWACWDFAACGPSRVSYILTGRLL